MNQAASAHQQHSFEHDFQLFDSPRLANQATLQLPSRGQAINRIAPNSSIQSTPRHLVPSVSQNNFSHNQSTIGHSHLPTNQYRSLTSPTARLHHLQRTVARQHQRVRPPVPKFHHTSGNFSPATLPRRRIHSVPTSSQGRFLSSIIPERSLTSNKVVDMSIFDHLDFQGGSYHDTSLDFDFDDSTARFESPDQPTTVSPTELWADEAMMSAPPSTAFPKLDTPGSEYLESPDISSGLNTTPMLEGALDTELDYSRLDAMPSLFPDADYSQFTSQPAIAPNNSFGSLSDLQSANSAQRASPMVRQKSSPGRPPITHDRKASLSAGIAKSNAAKKNNKDLPDIVIESEDDKETAKRKKNTAAARKSRARKQESMNAMAGEINRLRHIIVALGGNPDDEYELA